jgi:hypothetical protein
MNFLLLIQEMLLNTHFKLLARYLWCARNCVNGRGLHSDTQQMNPSSCSGNKISIVGEKTQLHDLCIDK